MAARRTESRPAPEDSKPISSSRLLSPKCSSPSFGFYARNKRHRRRHAVPHRYDVAKRHVWQFVPCPFSWLSLRHRRLRLRRTLDAGGRPSTRSLRRSVMSTKDILSSSNGVKHATKAHAKRLAAARNGSRAASVEGKEKPDGALERAKRVRDSNERAAIAKRALDSGVPITEWDRLSTASRTEVEHLVEVLKSVKQGDFGARFEYQKDG